MNRQRSHALNVSRRHFFADCGVGVGKIALGMLLGESCSPGRSAGRSTQSGRWHPRSPTLRPRRRR